MLLLELLLLNRCLGVGGDERDVVTEEGVYYRLLGLGLLDGLLLDNGGTLFLRLDRRVAE